MRPWVLFMQLGPDTDRWNTGSVFCLIGRGNFELDAISALTLHMVGEDNGNKENVANPSPTFF